MLYLALHNFMVIHKSVSHIKATDCLTFRLQLVKGVIGEQRLIVPHPVYNCPSLDLLPKTQGMQIFRRIHTMGERQNHKEDELRVLNKL